MKKHYIFILTFVVTILIQTSSAHATLVWDWFFLNSGITIAPTENVVQLARLTNNSTAGETIGYFPSGIDYRIKGAGIVGELGYDYSFGPESDGGDFFTQFTGLTLDPGESFDFTLAVYDPIGSATVGYHEVHYQNIWLTLMSSPVGTNIYGPGHIFEWCTDLQNGCAAGPVIPEPASMLLFGLGAPVLGMIRRKVKSV